MVRLRRKRSKGRRSNVPVNYDTRENIYITPTSATRTSPFEYNRYKYEGQIFPYIGYKNKENEMKYVTCKAGCFRTRSRKRNQAINKSCRLGIQTALRNAEALSDATGVMVDPEIPQKYLRRLYRCESLTGEKSGITPSMVRPRHIGRYSRRKYLGDVDIGPILWSGDLSNISLEKEIPLSRGSRPYSVAASRLGKYDPNRPRRYYKGEVEEGAPPLLLEDRKGNIRRVAQWDGTPPENASVMARSDLPWEMRDLKPVKPRYGSPLLLRDDKGNVKRVAQWDRTPPANASILRTPYLPSGMRGLKPVSQRRSKYRPRRRSQRPRSRSRPSDRFEDFASGYRLGRSYDADIDDEDSNLLEMIRRNRPFLRSRLYGKLKSKRRQRRKSRRRSR